MRWRDLLWGWQGRINRIQFLTGLTLLGVPVMIVGTRIPPPSDPDLWLNTLSVYGLVMLPFLASLEMRRLHDTGYRGAWIPLVLAAYAAVTVVDLLLPDRDLFWLCAVIYLPANLAGLFGVIALGQEGANRFGAPPAPGFPKRF